MLLNRDEVPATPAPVPAPTRGIRQLASSGVLDRRDRALRDLRISVTDRCNFRCVYCMPKEIFGRDYQFMERDELLSFEEITRLARIAIGLGVTKIRLTGGEPLLRRGIEELVRQIAELRTPDGEAPDLALTTNGSALPVKAQALKDAGLRRVTVSVDSLDDELFQSINDVRFPVSRVLDGIRAAKEVGLGPIKINAVIKRGTNDDEILPLAEHFRGTGLTLRFIEFMDVGASNGWALEQVVPSDEVIERINAKFPLEPLEATSHGETAKRWRYVDGGGEIGVISSVTHAFCGSCTRARLSADGKLFTCLFANEGFDLRSLLRDGARDSVVADALTGVWEKRDDRYSEIRSELTDRLGSGSDAGRETGRSARKRIEMSYIGG